MDKEKSCYKCKFRRTIPGDANSACSFDWRNNIENFPRGDPHGVRNGWWVFPFNYDPVWMIGECKEFSKKA